jgi:hypothetical protein
MGRKYAQANEGRQMKVQALACSMTEGAPGAREKKKAEGGADMQGGKRRGTAGRHLSPTTTAIAAPSLA